MRSNDVERHDNRYCQCIWEIINSLCNSIAWDVGHPYTVVKRWRGVNWIEVEVCVGPLYNIDSDVHVVQQSKSICWG